MTIYGETIEGTVYKVLENTIIIKSITGEHHMVHKDSLGNKYKAERKADRCKSNGFDLAACQTIGNISLTIRSWRKIQ